MGIDVGGNNGRAMASMNVVPLIDILLVLLIIFLVITPMTPKGLNAQIPQTLQNDGRPGPDYKVVVVQVLENDRLKINEQAATWEAFVKGGDTVVFGVIARAIDVMRSSGVEKVGLMTAKFDARQ
jgi:biopolymer transport protein ExbD